MIIGIDGGVLSVKDDRLKAGVYRVAEKLMEYLPVVGYSNNYRIYTFRKVGERYRRIWPENLEERLLRPPKGWHKIRLPLELLINPVNVFLGISQSIPYNLSHNIGFIYDLHFLKHPDHYPGTAQSLKANTEYLVKHSGKIVTISQATKKDIVSMYAYPEADIKVCYPGVSRIFSTTGGKFSHRKPYILYVGSLSKSKNIPELIRTFAAFNQKMNHTFDLLLVGGNYWYDPQIGETIKSTDQQNNVVIKGYMPDRLLPAVYRGAKAFMTLSAYEGFCLPVAEAMACGIPVIGPDSGAIPEVVGNHGYLVNPKDQIGTVLTMEKAISADGQTHIKSAIQTAAGFNWKVFAQQVFQVIKSYEE